MESSIDCRSLLIYSGQECMKQWIISTCSKRVKMDPLWLERNPQGMLTQAQHKETDKRRKERTFSQLWGARSTT
jgi:hypothetical protein